MTHYIIISDPEKCSGCGRCELACSMYKEGSFSRQLSRIHMVRLYPPFDMALSCLLCENPPCIRSCPRKALTKSEKSGFIIVDENKCIGCGWCIRACDFGVLTLHPDKKVAIVCDLCDGDPQCVKYCELDALEYTTFEKLAEKTRRSILMTKILETAQSRGVMQSLTMTGKPCKAYDSSKQNNSIMQTYAQWQPKQPSYPYAQQ